MASNSNILTTVYNFDQVNNKFVNKALQSIPLPAMFVAAQSPDSSVFCYSKVVYEFPRGLVKEAYTAETVAQLSVKANS